MIYVAQPTNGGPIRIGASADVNARKRTLGTWLPGGIEMMLQLKGAFLGEAILLQCFDPIRIERGWFKSSPPIWQFIIDASRRQPFWLPKDEGPSPKLPFDELVEEFGGRERAYAELGYGSLQTFEISAKAQTHAGYGLAARVMFRRLLRDGKLPDYISSLHEQDPARATRQGEAAA